MSLPHRITFEGGYSLDRLHEVRAAFAQALESGSPVLIDLSAVQHIDSIFVSELLMFRRRAVAARQNVVILVGTGNVLRIITLANLNERFELFNDEEMALRALAGTPPPEPSEPSEPDPAHAGADGLERNTGGGESPLTPG